MIRFHPVPHRVRRLSLVAALLLLTAAVVAQAQTTPAGRWRAVDDATGRPSAIVELREVDGQYVGVIKALLDPADDSTAVCDVCPDTRKGQRILGMEILRGMRPDGAGWSGGSILDPETGKTYHAKMHLEDGGTRLILRGYIGVPMFGRSQTWRREPDQR